MNRNNQQAKRELIAAAKSGDLGGVRAALARWEGPAQPYQQKPLGEALVAASGSGQTLVASYLIDQGAPRQTQARNALYNAALRGHRDTLELLLSRFTHTSAEIQLAFFASAEGGHLRGLKTLIEAGADLSAGNNQALRHSTANGKLECAKFLLELGANPRSIVVGMFCQRLIWRNGNAETAKEFLKLLLETDKGEEFAATALQETEGDFLAFAAKVAEIFEQRINIEYLERYLKRGR
jgi:ankyrin repeat protein